MTIQLQGFIGCCGGIVMGNLSFPYSESLILSYRNKTEADPMAAHNKLILKELEEKLIYVDKTYPMKAFIVSSVNDTQVAFYRPLFEKYGWVILPPSRNATGHPVYTCIKWFNPLAPNMVEELKTLSNTLSEEAKC